MNDDLYRAVGALVDTTRVRILRDDGSTETQRTPSLWTQLRASAQVVGSGAGGSTRFGSRPVISVGVVALIVDIETSTAEAADELNCEHRGGDLPANLRAVAATLTDVELIAWWTERVRHWTAEARERLHLDPQRPRSARGARCPQCGAKDAHRRTDGELVRMPALMITWVGPDDADYHEDSDWKVRAVECRACSHAWFRGSDLDDLVEAMLLANQTRETMADVP